MNKNKGFSMGATIFLGLGVVLILFAVLSLWYFREKSPENTLNSVLAPKSQQLAQSISQQLKTKFSLDILNFWGVEEVFQDPKNPYIFYYVSEDGSGYSIGKFDTSKDRNYLLDENPDIPLYNEFLYNENLSNNNEFRGVGFDGNKFVFAETNRDDSPGPCFSGWSYKNLNSIDISDTNISKIERKPYIAFVQKLQEIRKEASDCQKNL